MITLSVDPGLRNLSFCVMNSNYEILLWDTFNILDSDDYHCESFFKNGKVCGRKCTMKYKEEQTSIYTCKTHFPKNIIKTKTNNFKKKNIDEYLLQDIALTFINRLQEIYDNNPLLKTLTNILIELQPKCNSKMVFISHILYGKFIELYKNTITIRFVRASQKLRAYTGPAIECKLKGAYAKRKFLSVKYTEWFLENKFSKEQCDKWLPFFLSHSKRDDMGDNFLMDINSITGIPKKQFKHKNGNELK
jgi:hypothetical protein